MICRYLVTSTAFSDCIALRFRVGEFFGAKLLRTGATARAAALSSGDCAREPPHFYRASKMGIPVAVTAYTLALCSLVSAVFTCTKNGSPDREAQRSFTKREKELNSLIIRNYESKENDHRGGTASRYQPLSQLPQDRKCPRHEETLLWSRLPIGALRRLHI